MSTRRDSFVFFTDRDLGAKFPEILIAQDWKYDGIVITSRQTALMKSGLKQWAKMGGLQSLTIPAFAINRTNSLPCYTMESCF